MLIVFLVLQIEPRQGAVHCRLSFVIGLENQGNGFRN